MKHLKIHLILFSIIYSYQSNNAPCPTNPDVPGTLDVPALMAFFTSTSVSGNWINSNGWTSNNCDPCGTLDGNDPWYGIQCGHLSKRVNLIGLGSNGLSGSLPPEIGNLEYLEVLYLVNNDMLSGTLPPQIGQLNKLTQLILTGCSFSGSMPSTFNQLVNLQKLVLSRNNFSGDLPNGLEMLTELELFDINFNNFSGALPPFGENQNELIYLLCNNNNFTGAVPASYGELTPEKLFLHDNELTVDYNVALRELCQYNFTDDQISDGNTLGQLSLPSWEEFCDCLEGSHLVNGDILLANNGDPVIITNEDGNCFRVYFDSNGGIMTESVSCP